MKYTNPGRETIDLVVEGKAVDGVPPTKSIGPGETADITPVENAHLQGLILAGALIPQGAEKKAAKHGSPEHG